MRSRLFLPLLLPLLSPALWADSFTSSAASLASKSIGSLSDSLSTSSESSSGQTEVQAGTYVVLQLAPVPERPGVVRLVLQGRAPLSPDQALALTLPAGVVAAQALQEGELLHLQLRPYGLAVARAAQHAEPFFLALKDPRELQTRAL